MLENTKLDSEKLSPEIEELQANLLAKIIGQDRAVKQIIKTYVPTTVNMHRENRPMGVFLFLGPTGVGKSETVKQFAKQLLGKRDAITKIDCNEFQESHEAMKLLGAPPSYVGYGDTPRLAQEKIDRFQTSTCKINIILFDEIEKAHPRLFDAILSILGDGQLTLGNGKSVDFSKSFIFLTSNLGSKEVKQMITGDGIGYQHTEANKGDVDDLIYRASKAAAEKKWRPEFLNRVDRLIVYRSLAKESFTRILEIELKALQFRVWQSAYKDFQPGSENAVPDKFTVSFKLTQAAKDFLLKEGVSDIYGARELNRVLDRYVAFPIATIISSKQVQHGDRIKIDFTEGEDKLTFLYAGNLVIQ